MGSVFGRISFFVNAGVRFIEEHAKLRAMAELWDELGRERYGVEDEKHRRFRYGVQVNSLGLTEAQPENNVYRIALEALAVTLGRGARARAIQLPAWNEALGLPRPWDQQWSLRLQQVLAYETDLLEYPDIFEGSKVMDGLVAELLDGARDEMHRVAELGGAVEAVDYMKAALVESHRERWRRIESGELTVVGMNRFTSTEPSPLTADADGGILVVDPEVEAERRAALERWRADRDQAAVDAALAELAPVARSDRRTSCRPRSPPPAPARPPASGRRRSAQVFGEYRAPTGVGEAAAAPSEELAELRDEVERVSEALGRRLKFLVGKPGLDGHSNGAEQIAVRARDAGMDVVYEGIRLTPAQIANSAAQEGVHVVGLSILSGSHRELIPAVLGRLREAGVGRRAGRRRRDHPRRRRRIAARGRRRRGLHAQGLGSEPDDARHHRPGRRAARRRHRRRGLTERTRASGRELGARLRARDLTAAPAVLNLVESRASDAREQAQALLREVSPAALGSEPPAHIVGVTGPPGVGKSSLLSRLVADWRSRGARWRCWPSIPARAGRAARCSATGRGSRPIPATGTCSSARPPPAIGSAASRRQPARPRRRWPRRSTWS